MQVPPKMGYRSQPRLYTHIFNAGIFDLNDFKAIEHEHLFIARRSMAMPGASPYE
jgi:hypothetical protein